MTKLSHSCLLIWTLILILSCQTAYAFNWRDLWLRPDQQGQQALQHNQPAQAAQLFRSPDWQGVAYYRNQNYQQALQAFSHDNSTQGWYNRGNALAQLGQYQPAIDAYDQALKQNPSLADARFNKELLEKLLKQQQQQNKNDQKQDPKQSKQNSSNSTQSQNSQPHNAQDKQQNSQPQNSQNNPSNAQSQNAQDNSSNSQPHNAQDKQQNSQPQNSQNNPSNAQSQNASNISPSGTVNKNNAQATPSSPHLAPPGNSTAPYTPQQQATEQWLQSIPDDPGGLLRQKFWRDHQNYEQAQQQGQQPW